MQNGTQEVEERTRDVMPRGEIIEFLDAEDKNQLVITVHGAPMRLKRVPFFKNF